jgi:fructokinase
VKIPQGDLDLLAIGETVIDLISVEETDALTEVATFRRYQGGSPANIARYVVKLGGSAALVSKVGDDALGRYLKQKLTEAGVETDHVTMDASAPTTVIMISRTPGTADSVALRSADYRLHPDDVTATLVRRAKVVHASTFALSREPARSAVCKAFRLAHEHGKMVSLDPNYNPAIWPERTEAQAVLEEAFRYANLSKPSLDDARRLFGPDLEPEEYIERYHDLGAELVVLTRGAQGTLLSTGHDLHRIPARDVEVADATGAGDAFWAGFIVALLDGNLPERCVLFGREVAEKALGTVGPLDASLDRAALYARIEPLW